MFDFLKNTFLNQNRYKTDSEAVIVSCFFNPQNSPYRLLAFQKWYKSIKHLNHRIVECLIGDDAKSQLPESPYITQVRSDSLLWHKEALLNKVIHELPEKFKYVFWLDADVLFTNNDWLVQAVQTLKDGARVIQPFEYCVHLERNQLVPDFNMDLARMTANQPNHLLGGNKRLWRSFCANYATVGGTSGNKDYDVHGHVGFAWGARREVLDRCPLFDHALIGGADHIIAHAAVGQIPHSCINNAFADNIGEVEEWSNRFYGEVEGKVSYVPGDLYHIWHGDIKDRQYLKRIKGFAGEAKEITDKDENGLYTTKKGRDRYVRQYYQNREVYDSDDFGGLDADFYVDMGYALSDVIQLFGQPYAEPDFFQPDPGVPGVPAEVGPIPFNMGGGGVPDNGQFIITDEQLQGATIASPQNSVELETAIHHASQPDVPDPAPVDVPAGDDGNFS